MAPSAPVDTRLVGLTPAFKCAPDEVESLPKTAPAALREVGGSKVYELKLRRPGDILEYRSLDGEKKYTKQNLETCKWSPSKWDGANWVEDDTLQTMPLIFSASLEPSGTKDKLSLKSGNKERIKDTFKTLGWGKPSGEISWKDGSGKDRGMLTFTKTDTGAHVTYYLSDDGKNWSTIRPQSLLKKPENNEEIKTPAVDESPYVLIEVGSDGKAIQGVKKRNDSDLYYVRIDVQERDGNKTHAFDYVYGYAEHPGLRLSSVGIKYGLPRVANERIIGLPPINLPGDQITSTTHDKYLLEGFADFSGSGMNVRVVGRFSDVGIPSTDNGNGQLSSGYLATVGAGIVTYSGIPGEDTLFRIMEKGAVTLQVGPLILFNQKGEMQTTGALVASSERDLLKFKPLKEGGPAFVVSLGLESLFPFSGGNAQSGIQLVDLVTKSALHFMVGLEWDFNSPTNTAVLRLPNRPVAWSEYISMGATSLLNVPSELGTYAGNISYNQIAAGPDNQTLLEARAVITTGVPAAVIYAAQDLNEGKILGRDFRNGNRLRPLVYLAVDAALTGALIGIGKGAPDKPQSDAEVMQLASLPLGIRRVGRLIVKGTEAALVNLSSSDPGELKGAAIAGGAFLASGLVFLLAPRALIPGKYDGGALANSHFGQNPDNRAEPDHIKTQATMDGIAAMGAELIGAAVMMSANAGIEYAMRAKRKRTLTGIQEASVATRDESGKPVLLPVARAPELVKKVNLALDLRSNNGAVSGAVFGLKAEGDPLYALTPRSARPRGRLDTDRNRIERRLDQVEGEMTPLAGRLRTVTDALKMDTVKSDPARVRALEEQAVSLRAQLAPLQEEVRQLRKERAETDGVRDRERSSAVAIR